MSSNYSYLDEFISIFGEDYGFVGITGCTDSYKVFWQFGIVSMDAIVYSRILQYHNLIRRDSIRWFYKGGDAVPLSDVLNYVEPEIRTKIIFNLDLFVY